MRRAKRRAPGDVGQFAAALREQPIAITEQAIEYTLLAIARASFNQRG
jgi:hypothetical protein